MSVLKRFRMLPIFILIIALILTINMYAYATVNTDVPWMSVITGFNSVTYGSPSTFVRPLQCFFGCYSYYTYSEILNSGGVDGIFGNRTAWSLDSFKSDNDIVEDPLDTAAYYTWFTVYLYLDCYSDYAYSASWLYRGVMPILYGSELTGDKRFVIYTFDLNGVRFTSSFTDYILT